MLIKILQTLLLCSFLAGNAQSILHYKLDGSEQGKSLSTVLEEIGRKNNSRFYFLPEWIAPISLDENYKGQTIGEALDNLFLGTELNYLSMYDAVVIIKDPTQALLRKNIIATALRQQKKVEQYKFGEIGKSIKGEKVNITGSVIDSKSKEPMSRAYIQINGTQNGTTSDDTGNYILTLDPGVYVLNISYVDYEDKIVDLVAYASGTINLEMEEKAILLEEVVIQDRAARELTTSRIGLTQLTMREVKRSPSMMGEADLIKQVQALPGVTTVGEAAAGYNVRGGSVDQNLILYDGMPVFNSSHVFGFFSAFNSEAIRDVFFYRGGIPAEYGGRISSVLDIRSRDGDYEKWNVNGGIGMIASNLMINGPIQKEKTAIAASFRSTYSNWLVHSIRTDYADLRESSAFFYDGTIKLTHLFNEKTKLSFTGYSSQDDFKLLGDTTYKWNNFQSSFRLDRQLSPKLTAEFIIGSSSYGYKVVNANPITASELSYQITSSLIKAGFNYQPGEHKLNFGWQLLHYRFNPGSLKPDNNVSNAKTFALDKQYAIENAFYITDEWAFTKRIFVEAGIRLPMFISFGPATVNIYQDNVPREISTISDTLNFKRWQPVKTYLGIEPRLSLRWMANPTTSVKLGYNHMYQYLHLVTNATAVTPVDIWQPSNYYFKPQRADQVSLGIFKDFRDKKYGASSEVYYKAINNILDFKDGAQLILNENLETDLLQGKGESYGVETSLTKNAGRLTGSINYTYSRSFRLIDGPTSSESVNDGQRYPANFDQPHIMNFAWKYNLSRRHFFTGNFTYHSGRPVTIPLSAFALENTTVAYFSQRNQYRIPDYHRLDLALVIEGSHKRNKQWKGMWVFSVYNVYGRKNPYTVFFKSDGNGVPKPYQLSIIGTAFPSISYNFKF